MGEKRHNKQHHDIGWQKRHSYATRKAKARAGRIGESQNSPGHYAADLVRRGLADTTVLGPLSDRNPTRKDRGD